MIPQWGEACIFWEKSLYFGKGRRAKFNGRGRVSPTPSAILSLLEGGQGFPDQFAFGEALKGEAGDVDRRLFTEDQLGHDLSYRRAVLEPVTAEAVG